jgi:hypothetical protein
MSVLDAARQQRLDRALDLAIDEHIDACLAKVQLAAPISPQARIKLRGILRKYAKDPHPFRACVRDNMKRFGPGRTEAICATLKDTIKGNKNWRKGGGSKLSESDEQATIDGDVLLALDAISECDLQQIMLEVAAMERYGTPDAVGMLETDGKSELRRIGAWS